jgi:hypothetical protein
MKAIRIALSALIISWSAASLAFVVARYNLVNKYLCIQRPPDPSTQNHNYNSQN